MNTTYRLDEAGPHNFTFSILGDDALLSAAAVPEVGTGVVAEPTCRCRLGVEYSRPTW